MQLYSMQSTWKNGMRRAFASTHLGDCNIIHMMKNNIKKGNKMEQKHQLSLITLSILTP